MQAEPNDPPIIISGGSVTLEFDSSQLTPNGNGKHSNAYKKIKRVEITIDGVPDFAKDIPNGKVTVKVIYGNDKS